MPILLNHLSTSEHVARFILKLKLYRELAGFSQNEMSEALGVSHRTYQRIEAGETSLDLEMILKVCAVLNIELGNWLNLDSPEKLDSVKVLDEISDELLNEDERVLKENFYQLSDSDEMSSFPSQPLFKESSSVLFFSWNTRKIANDMAANLSRLENSTKITSGYSNPQNIISYIDWLNIHRPAYTLINPVSLKLKGDAKFYAYNYHLYKEGDVLIFSILRPHLHG